MSSVSSTTTHASLSLLTKAFDGLRLNALENSDPPMPEQKQSPTAASQMSKPVGRAKRVLIVKNAHQDDIHGMISIDKSTFVTGSKDGSLKMWNTAGKLVKTVWSPKVINYTNWITALTPFGPNFWMSGTRDGSIDLWHNNGAFCRNLNGAARTVSKIQCKSRNKQRINCLSQDVLAGQYYVGIATQFSLHQVEEAQPLSQCTTSQNDWVYCVRPFAERKIMVVTGPYLDLFTYDQKLQNWVAESLLSEQQTRSGKHQRPFISDVVFLQSKTTQCALAVFGGPVIVFDHFTKTCVRTYNEHSDRVWQVVNIRPNIFVSSSDDRTIKIWDTRLAQSAHTISDHVGRVSTLLSMSDTFLVSGSCPDDLRRSNERARLEFWDIRML